MTLAWAANVADGMKLNSCQRLTGEFMDRDQSRLGRLKGNFAALYDAGNLDRFGDGLLSQTLCTLIKGLERHGVWFRLDDETFDYFCKFVGF